MRDSILKIKSEAFAIRIVNLSKHLIREHNERRMSDQILRSGTSISANIAEAIFAQSDADFVSKLHTSLKEASETRHWLYLLYKTDYLTENEYSSMLKDCDEMLRLLIFSVNKVKSKIKN